MRLAPHLELLALAPGARAVWLPGAGSTTGPRSVSKFGDSNLQALRAIAEGRGADRWEAGGLTPERLALLRALPLAAFSAESASALLWCLRNETYFLQGLDRRADVQLVSYEQFCAAPQQVMADLCAAWASPTARARGAGGAPGPVVPPAPLDLDPRVRAMCDDMAARLDAACRPRPGTS